MVEELMGLGCLPSPWDNKRLLYAVRAPTFDEAEALPEEYDGLKDIALCQGSQGNIGSCCGWAGKHLTHAIVRLNDKQDLEFSAGSIYWHSREYCDPPLPDNVQGSYALAVMKLLQKNGATTEKLSPTDTSHPFQLNDKPGWDVVACCYKIVSYHAVPVDQASLKAAIYGVTYEQPYKDGRRVPG